MSAIVLTSETLISTPASGNIEYNGQFFGTDSNASRAQMQRITQGTVVSASGTAVDFTGLPAWVKRITVMLAGVKQNTNGANPFAVRLGTSGGIVATGYVGSAGYFGGAPGSVALNTGFDIYFDTATYLYSGTITITNITGNTWVASGTIGQTQGYQIVIGGYVALGSALTQLRFTTNNGTNTFTAGSINILYEG